MVAQEVDENAIKVELPPGFIQQAVQSQVNAHIAAIIASQEKSLFSTSTVSNAIERMFRNDGGCESKIQGYIEIAMESSIKAAVWEYFDANAEFKAWLTKTIDGLVKSEACQKAIADNVLRAILEKSA